jgi:hypothetical protein
MRSPLKQTDFCAAHGISTRALRGWMSRLGDGDRPEARALAIIDEALEKLTALRAAVVAEAEDHLGAGDDATPDEPKRHAEPEATPGPQLPAAVEPVRPKPMPGAGFVWL